MNGLMCNLEMHSSQDKIGSYLERCDVSERAFEEVCYDAFDCVDCSPDTATFVDGMLSD